MIHNNLYTVNPLYNDQLDTYTSDNDAVQSPGSGGGTIIIGGGMTAELKLKLDGILSGAEVNQNAFSNAKIISDNNKIVAATTKTDTLNITGQLPVLLTLDESNIIKVSISSEELNKIIAEQIDKGAYWKKDELGNVYTESNVYSTKEISAYGLGPGGGGGGGAGALYECADVLRDGDKVYGAIKGALLSYNGTHWYAIPQSDITPDLTGYATESWTTSSINTAVNKLIDSAPGTLDTLNEIAAALGDDPNFAATITGLLNTLTIRVTDVENKFATFSDMFEWDKSNNATDPTKWVIKAKRSLYSIGEITAYGLSSEDIPTNVSYLSELKDVKITDPKDKLALVYDAVLSKWVNGSAIPEIDLSNYVTLNTEQIISARKVFRGASFNKLDSQTLPTSQVICVNGIDNASSNGYLPAIGFHIPNVTYASIVLQRDVTFAFLNADMSDYIGVTAARFVKYGGNSNQLLRADGGISTFEYSGQSGQPAYVWGTIGQYDYRVWNPSNFRVANANTIADYPHTLIPIYRGWIDAPGANANDASNAISFSYSNNCPHTGALVTFDPGRYSLQFSSSYFGSNLSMRTKNGDINTWNAWTKVLTGNDWTSTIDGRYLPLTGGTITGSIAVIGYSTTNAWFQNNNAGYGLYNAANDARWYAQGGRWISDKPIVGIDFINSGWYTTTGNTGWYSSDYGGGWHMTDSTYIRSYGSKRVHIDNLEFDALNVSGGIYTLGQNGYGLTINGSESTTTRISGQIGAGIDAAISRYSVQWYGETAAIDVHRGGSSNITKWSFKHNGNERFIFDMSGNMVASGEVTAYSDVRLKSNIQDLTVRGRLQPKTFIKDNKESIGFIALDILELYPELILVGTDNNHYLSVNYGAITAVLSALLNTVEDEISVLKNRVRELEDRLYQCERK